MEKTIKERHLAPSVHVVLAQLKRLHMTKAELAQQMGVSQDYIYRILNGRIAFPYARETIERNSALSISARLVWQRLRELGKTREDLFQALGGRISRPYFNSILRGDQPFPTNRAYIQMFALALDLPPTAFVEFGPQQAPRWEAKDLLETEDRTYQMFFDAMMAAYGYARHPVSLTVLELPKVLAFFQPKAVYAGDLDAILARMGELGMGFRELEKVSGVPSGQLRALLSAASRTKTHQADIRQIRAALHMA
jgi:transcriptional regulator with XRE-family HTH domain